MKKGFSKEFNLGSNQKRIVNRWIGAQTYIYNAKCEEDDYFYKTSKSALSLTGQHPKPDQQYSHLRQHKFNSVPSQILRNGAVRWFDAKKRFMRGLAENPRKKKGHQQSCMVTNELFTLTTKESKYQGEWLYLFNIVKIGVIVLRLDKRIESEVKTLTLNRKGGRFFLSFSYDDGVAVKTQAEIYEELRKLSKEELLDVTNGHDRGVVINCQSSDGTSHQYSEEEKLALQKQERYQRKLQRKLSRQKKGSKNSKKTLTKLNKSHAKTAHIKENRNHHISKSIADSPSKAEVFEKLKLTNMTKRPKAKKDPVTGKWLRNGAKAKTGLTKAILSVNMGQLQQFTKYKCLQKEKLFLEANPRGSSQECRMCEHSSPNNRLTQESFVCEKCGHAENADFNASNVVKHRGVLDLISGNFEPCDQSKIKVGTRRLRGRACGGNVRGTTIELCPDPKKQEPSPDNAPVEAS